MTAPPRLPHWRKLSCRPITAAVCQVHHLTQNALQKLHVCTHLCTHSIVAGSICSKIHTYIYYLYFIFLAITGAISPLITFLRCMFSLQIRSMTACRQVTVCWVILLVRCRGAEIQMGLQWNTTRRTRGATLTEVRQSALEVPKS